MIAESEDPKQRLLYWITERESIRRKKEAGEPKPWTDDPILRAGRFTNVRREDDHTTKWVVQHWREPHANDSDCWFAMAAAVFINRIETLAALGHPVPYDRERFLAVVAEIVAETRNGWARPIASINRPTH
jgi:5-hmdU DNA kinase, helical domain